MSDDSWYLGIALSFETFGDMTVFWIFLQAYVSYLVLMVMKEYIFGFRHIVHYFDQNCVCANTSGILPSFPQIMKITFLLKEKCIMGFRGSKY